jgi:hypothetical protein
MLVLGSPAIAEVCYSPEGRGLSLSRYQVDTLSSPWLNAPMDFSADPWAVGGSEFLDFSRPEVFAAYERRYGAGTACTGGLAETAACAGHVFKRFAGPGNEVRSQVTDALAWWYVKDRAGLGGSPRCHGDGRPSEREITDAQATNDRRLWERWHSEGALGGSTDRPQLQCEPSKAPGLRSEADPFWGWNNWIKNTCGNPPATPSPSPRPIVACEAPPADVLAAARRALAKSSAKAASRKVVEWLEAQARRCGGK